MSLSAYERLLRMPPEERRKYAEQLPDALFKEMAERPWWLMSRPEQQSPPGDWVIWLILSGRGWGKTRTGAEWLWQQIKDHAKSPDGTPTEWAIVAPTYRDVRDTCVEGPSGILRVIPREALRYWNRSTGTILFTNGVRVHCFGADNRDAGRGKNLAGAWLDEFAMWPYPADTWTEGLAPALRIGAKPRVVVTTTPKPLKILRDWINRTDGSVYVTRGATFDNAANLSKAALEELQARYTGTRIGRQELYGEILDNIDGALWTEDTIERSRVINPPDHLTRIVVGVDPAVTNTEDSDETGIIVAGKDARSEGWVLADYTMRGTPLEWATRAVEAYRLHNADAIVVEVNNGGDMIPNLIAQVDAFIPVREVRATRGKKVRAEPIAAFYEQGRVHHVGRYTKLEEQMTTWTPDSPNSPDRLDALVWAMTDLLDGSPLTGYLSALAVWCNTCSLPMPKSLAACSNCGLPLSESDSTTHPLGV